jgi:hypothetical protein
MEDNKDTNNSTDLNTEVEVDYKDIRKNNYSAKVDYTLTTAMLALEENLDTNLLIEKELIEEDDEKLFRTLCVILYTSNYDDCINKDQLIADKISSNIGIFPGFKKNIPKEDFLRIVNCSKETYDAIIEMRDRRFSNIQLSYHLRAAYDHRKIQPIKNIHLINEQSLIFDCLALMDLHGDNLTEEILQENLGHKLPLLGKRDYKDIVKGYTEYINRE